MSKFVDFAELKARTTFEQVVAKLGLKAPRKGNQWRMECPRCKAGGPRSLVITEGKGFMCFAFHQGGDQIALVGHILDIGVKEAAEFLAGETSTVPRNSTSGTVPQGASGEETKKFPPLAYLEAEHQAVDAIGFDTEFAKKYGIGYAGKGILRGTVAIPFRDEQGHLLGYIGITDAKLPADFTPNVVKFPESA